MAMTLEELEMESAELIPAREVMCAASYWSPCHRHCDQYSWYNSGQNDSGNGGAFQIGLVNLNNSFNNISVRV